MDDAFDWDARQVADALEAGAIQLVDVREPYEHAAGAIAGAAHVEMDALAAASQQLDPARPVVFYCRVGGRSAWATQAFREAGWDAHNLAGGALAWAAAGLPLTRPDGSGAPGVVADH